MKEPSWNAGHDAWAEYAEELGVETDGLVRNQIRSACTHPQAAKKSSPAKKSVAKKSVAKKSPAKKSTGATKSPAEPKDGSSSDDADTPPDSDTVTDPPVDG